MAEQTQVRRIKCPYCGNVRKIPVGVIDDESMASVTKGIGEVLKSTFDKIREKLSDTQMDTANAWVDMPYCPNCFNVYRYNVRTGEVQK